MIGFDVRADTDGVLWLSGEIDMATVEEFRAAADSALDGHGRFVFDLSELAFLDSSGIRAILRLASRAPVVLRRPRENVRRVLSIAGIVGAHGISLED